MNNKQSRIRIGVKRTHLKQINEICKSRGISLSRFYEEACVSFIQQYKDEHSADVKEEPET